MHHWSGLSHQTMVQTDPLIRIRIEPVMNIQNQPINLFQGAIKWIVWFQLHPPCIYRHKILNIQGHYDKQITGTPWPWCLVYMSLPGILPMLLIVFTHIQMNKNSMNYQVFNSPMPYSNNVICWCRHKRTKWTNTCV